MALDELQKPNVGTPEFAAGRSTSERKVWAIVTTVAFAVFWFSGLFLAAGLYGQQSMHWSAPVLAVLGLGVGLYARRKVDAD
ncbi:hypothetical protein N8I71_01580 [Roseibacterium sp. SDUM158016]|uniref:hypothetical protein n=1 Tax=Roseicyclus sediminis TaxID=2980997 RepID=UPI0021CF62C6|nr:hypothetical protein [Roseibacterium sp. SDUM158016]MCU4651502.1 hypothetical protein [Roseibacterium sp. SDUM158016]